MTHTSERATSVKWNWQRKDWPDFTYVAEEIRPFEERILTDGGLLFGSLEHLDKSEKDRLSVEIITEEALKTSEIEGEYLNRDSVRSSILRRFGLKADSEKIPPAEKGVAEMMMSVHEEFSAPVTRQSLCGWHGMLMSGRTDLEDKGRYRKSGRPMLVVSGPVERRRVHFEAPPSRRVPSEMKLFTDWFNGSAPGGKAPLPAVARAGIAHLYFVSIHPFEDGNGRIARAIAEKALSQRLGRPALTALSAFIQENGKDYYDALERANKNNEVTGWLVYFGEVVTKAQAYSRSLVDFAIKKVRMFDRLKNEINERQKKALLRIFREGPKGFEGGLSAGNYIAITKTTRQTAARDLSDLVRKGALVREGERRYARYFLRLE